MDATQLAAEIHRIINHPRGVIGRMSDLEYEKGYGIIPYGATGATEPIPFSKEDWHDGVITFDEGRKEIRIVAVYARQQQRGALTRLIEVIRQAGYRPVVIEPIGHIMPAIIRHWGWHCTVVKHDNEAVHEWRPVS